MDPFGSSKVFGVICDLAHPQLIDRPGVRWAQKRAPKVGHLKIIQPLEIDSIESPCEVANAPPIFDEALTGQA